MTKPFTELNTPISRLGFGCMRFPLLESGKIDRIISQQMIDLAYQKGVTYFDTAWGYHDEESQYFLGEALVKYPRESFQLTTKLPPWLLKTKEDVSRIFQEQLERCQVEYFDYYLLHSMTKHSLEITEKCKAYEFLQKKKEEGVIKHLGFSFHGDLQTLEKMLENYQWDFVQLQINYFDFVFPGSNAKTEYEMVTAKGLPVIVMEPIRGGFLANLPTVTRGIMEEYSPSATPSSWALRWCMSQKNIPLILSGMSALSHVEDNLKTFQQHKELAPQEYKVLHKVTEELQKVDMVPCTACGYCRDCSFGVNIPELFSLYNNYQLFAKIESVKEQYASLVKENKDFSACTHCGECVPLCPQSIQIPEELERVSIIAKEL